MNFKENYKLQDKVLSVLSGEIPDFYLTGGTALSRFYLHHRFSEDLDFFADNISNYSDEVLRIRKLLSEVINVSEDKLLQYESFSRIWISNGTELKIEVVNDTGKRWGIPIEYDGIFIDTVANILTNKLTALISRDEPKDIFDIVTISENYSFNWDQVFSHTVEKAFINEPDISIKLRKFPVELLDGRKWLKTTVDSSNFLEKVETIVRDFTFARDNSLGVDKEPITDARLNVNHDG